jgi:hypothetical protein
LLPFGQELIIPTSRDLALVPVRDSADVGLTRLVANLSPVQGYPTATARWGDELYVTYYDGADSWLLRLRRPQALERVPHPFVIVPLVRIQGYKVGTMLVTADAEGNVWLLYDRPSATAGRYDVGCCVLGPALKRRYAPAGEWYSQRMGDPAKLTSIERFLFYGVDCSPTSYWEVSLRWDEGAWVVVGRVDGPGRRVLEPTPGVNDSGYQYQLRLTYVRAAVTDRPRLRGMTAGREGSGLVVVEGQRQAEAVDRFRYTLSLAEHQETGRGGRVGGTVSRRHLYLSDLQNRIVPLQDYDFFGDYDTRLVRITSVRAATGRQAGQHQGERRVVVDARFALSEVE